jgi:hypothetical protein
MGDEGDYRGNFYPEYKQYVTNNTKVFLRTTPTGYTSEFAGWLKKTGRKNVIMVVSPLTTVPYTLHWTF